MPAAALLIGIGLITILWGHWFAPQQLRKIRERATPKGRERYDGFMNPPGVSRALRLPAIVGGVAVLIGVAYLLTEL